MHAFQAVTPCRLVYSYRRFGLYCFLYLQCPYLLVMLSHTADDVNLGHHRCKILVSHSVYVGGGNRRPFTVNKNICDAYYEIFEGWGEFIIECSN